MKAKAALKAKANMKAKLGKLALGLVKAKVVAKKAKAHKGHAISEKEQEAIIEAFPKGSAVRILDEGLGKVYFGLGWTVQAHSKSGWLSLVGAGGKRVEVQVHQVVKDDFAKPSALQGFHRVKNAEKVDWLLEAGFAGEETEQEWEGFRAEVRKEDPFRLWNGHVALYSKYLLWALQVPSNVGVIANPMLVQAWIEGIAGEGSDEFLANHRLALQALCRERQLVLVPIWSANGGPGQEH